MDDNLVALTRRTGVEAVVKGRLREQSERIGLLLGHRRRFCGHTGCADSGIHDVRFLIQRPAVSACMRAAPASGVSRPRTTTIPSSS